MARFAGIVAVAVAALWVTPVFEGGGATDAPAGGHARARSSVRPAGTLVALVGANRLVAIDVASGRRRTRRMRSLAACGPQLHVVSGRLVFAGLRGSGTVVLSIPTSLKGRPKRLGAAHAFVPSATAGRVWLAGVACSRRSMGGVREVTADGRVMFHSRERVPGDWLAGAVEGGLLVHRGRRLRVWDPRGRGTPRRLPLEAAADAHGSLVAGCSSRCRNLLIVDTKTGRTVTARPQHPYRLDAGAEFSPDGSLLVAPALAERGSSRARRVYWSVALVDTRDGSTTIVPGSETGRSYPDPTWARSSGWLFFAARHGQVMAYRPGARRAVALSFRLPRYSSFSAG